MRQFGWKAAVAVSLAMVMGCAPQPPFEEVTDPFASPLPASPAVETAPITSNAPPGPTSPVDPRGGPVIAPVETPTATDAPPTEAASDTVTEVTEGGLVERLPNTCKLETYQQYVGQLGSMAQAEVLDRPTRVIAPGDIVTQEYNPQRVNFYTNEGGVVQRITCG